MALEVKESFLGRIVPEHLLKFSENQNFQFYYRNLVKVNYGKGLDKIDLGQCSSCHASQTIQDRPRLKPTPVITKKIHRLLKKQSLGKELRNYEERILRKFLDTKQQMIVRCPQCQSINRMELMSKQDLILLKNHLQMKVVANADLKTSEQGSKSVKKKKRKKKKKEEESFIPNSLISQPIDTVTPSRHSTTAITQLQDLANSSQSKKSASLHQLIKPLTQSNQPTSSSSLLQKSMATPYVPTSSKPLSVSTPVTSKSANLIQESRSSSKRKFVSKQKQLKRFLKDSIETEKPKSSLSDFLSSL